MPNRIGNKNKIISALLCIAVIISFGIFMYSLVDCSVTYTKVKIKINQQNEEYQTALAYNNELINTNLDDQDKIDELVIKKAREEGYIFPDEVVFYDAG